MDKLRNIINFGILDHDDFTFIGMSIWSCNIGILRVPWGRYTPGSVSFGAWWWKVSFDD